MKEKLGFGLLALLFVGGLILLGTKLDPTSNLLAKLYFLPRPAPELFILCYILSCVLLLPGFLLTYAAGIIFGVIPGIIYVSIGATLGASISFLLGRFFFRSWISRKVTHTQKFALIDSAVAKEGWKIVLLCRLCPLIPFRLSNYAFGLTDISFRNYIFATWLGTLPSASVYVYVGSIIGDVATLQAERPLMLPEIALYALGVITLLGGLFFLTKVSRSALQKKLFSV